MNEPTPSAARSVWNVPNQLTAARLLLSIAVFILIPLGKVWGDFPYLLAAIFFILAAATDWMDGYWARRFNQVTQLGRIFDPFVDKVLICGTYILLAEAMSDYPHPAIHGWVAVLVMGREMLVTVIRSYIEQQGGDFSAKMPGKLKMVFQCIAAVAALWVLQEDPDAIPPWLNFTLFVFLWLTIVFTVYSGAGYVRAAAKILQPK